MGLNNYLYLKRGGLTKEGGGLFGRGALNRENTVQTLFYAYS